MIKICKQMLVAITFLITFIGTASAETLRVGMECTYAQLMDNLEPQMAVSLP